MNPVQDGIKYPVRFGQGTTQVKLFTHTDLDGISCEIAFRISKLYDQYSFDCRRLNYNEPGVEEVVKDFKGNVYVTDLKMTNEFWNKMPEGTIVIDHHQWDGEVPKNITLEHNLTVCAAFATLDYLEKNHKLRFVSTALRLYFKYVDAYDMWRKNTKDFERGKILNHLLHTIGKDKFVELMMQRMYADLELVTDEEVKDYQKYQSSMKERAQHAIQQMTIFADNEGHKCGFVASDSTQSEVMNMMLELAPEIEYIAVFNRVKKSVSLRRQEASNLDLHIIAQRYGGRGHQAAAGYPMSEHFVKGYRI